MIKAAHDWRDAKASDITIAAFRHIRPMIRDGMTTGQNEALYVAGARDRGRYGRGLILLGEASAYQHAMGSRGCAMRGVLTSLRCSARAISGHLPQFRLRPADRRTEQDMG